MNDVNAHTEGFSDGVNGRCTASGCVGPQRSPTLHIYDPPWDALGYNASVARAVAACIPVLTISVDFLPFRSIVPWANISVSVSAKALLAYHAAARANASKLPANPLAFLAEMSDERIRRMQEQLLHYRWAMAYRRPAAPSAVHSIAQELQEHVSQNPVRQS